MLSFAGLLPAALVIGYLIYEFASGSDNAPSKAFIKIYLPCLMLFHMGFYIKIPLLPVFNFGQSALIPVFLGYLLLPSTPKHRARNGLRLLDILVIGYVISCVVSEYLNTGMMDGSQGVLWRTLAFRLLFNVLVPYYLARKLIHPYGLTPLFMKVLVICCLLTLVVCFYEWRMVVNLHVEVFKKFFKYSEEQWIPTFRYGLVRVSGPHGHPILFGIILASSFLFNHWLIRNKSWHKNFLFVEMRAKVKGYLIGLILFLGLVLVFSRGPLFSALIALIILGIGYSRRKYLSLFTRSIMLLIVAYFCYQMYQYYSSITPGKAITTLDNTGAYRVQLIQKYLKHVNENFWIGYGFTTWPKAAGMHSIDNQYLWLTLIHGFIALSFYVSIILVTMSKLFIRGMKISFKDQFNRSLAFTLLSVIFMLAVSLVTVYMGQQVETLFFMVVGLSQGFIDTVTKKRSMPSPALEPVRA